MRKKRQLVLVHWQDISSYGRWIGEDEVASCKTIDCHTVGWTMDAGRGALKIAGTRASNRTCSDITIIPHRQVISIRLLVHGKMMRPGKESVK